MSGFVTGLSEKVRLGACPTAMLCPEPNALLWVLDLVYKIAEIYSLHVLTDFAGGEIWICRDERYRDIINDLLSQKGAFENTEIWHEKRGRLCGIPRAEIDLNYHKRGK